MNLYQVCFVLPRYEYGDLALVRANSASEAACILLRDEPTAIVLGYPVQV